MGKKWNALQEQKLISEEYEKLLQDCEDFEAKSPEEQQQFLDGLDDNLEHEGDSNTSFDISQREEEEEQRRK